MRQRRLQSNSAAQARWRLSQSCGRTQCDAESVRALLHGVLDKTGATPATARWVPRSWDAVLKKVNDQQRQR